VKHDDAKDHGLPRWNELLKDCVNVPGKVAECYNLFHNYSIGNQQLAMWQCLRRDITPGPIGTYKKWVELERKVNKGEKAIILCQPVTWMYDKEENGETKQYTAMRFVYKPRWFVLSQTDGKEYVPEELPGWEIGNALWNLEVEPIEYAKTSGNCMGYAAQRTFAINPLGKHQNATTFHELAHIVLGHTEDLLTDTKDRTPKDKREMEAESTAMLVLDALGEKDHAESRGYIQSWYKENEIDEDSARRIFAAANKILEAGRKATTQEKAA
jgi:antirestriction protein ArdC